MLAMMSVIVEKSVSICFSTFCNIYSTGGAPKRRRDGVTPLLFLSRGLGALITR